MIDVRAERIDGTLNWNRLTGRDETARVSGMRIWLVLMLGWEDRHFLIVDTLSLKKVMKSFARVVGES